MGEKRNRRKAVTKTPKFLKKSTCRESCKIRASHIEQNCKMVLRRATKLALIDRLICVYGPSEQHQAAPHEGI